MGRVACCLVESLEVFPVVWWGVLFVGCFVCCLVGSFVCGVCCLLPGGEFGSFSCCLVGFFVCRVFCLVCGEFHLVSFAFCLHTCCLVGSFGVLHGGVFCWWGVLPDGVGSFSWWGFFLVFFFYLGSVLLGVFSAGGVFCLVGSFAGGVVK